MMKVGLGEFGSFYTAAEIIVALKHADKVPLFRQQCGAGKRIDTATDNNVVIDCSHY